jgi:hypothetical protein
MNASGWFFVSIKIIVLFISFLWAPGASTQELSSGMDRLPSAALMTPEHSAMTAAVADGLTTNLALSAGAIESNPMISTSPIGLMALTGMKIGLVKYAGTLSEPDKRLALKSSSALWGGASINNMAVYLSASPLTSIVAGILMGIATWVHIQNKFDQEDKLLAARQIQLPSQEERVAEVQDVERP